MAAWKRAIACLEPAEAEYLNAAVAAVQISGLKGAFEGISSLKRTEPALEVDRTRLWAAFRELPVELEAIIITALAREKSLRRPEFQERLSHNE